MHAEPSSHSFEDLEGITATSPDWTARHWDEDFNAPNCFVLVDAFLWSSW